MYLNSQVISIRFLKENQFAFINCGVIQLTFVFSALRESHIDGPTVRLHIAHQTAAPFIRYLLTPDRVTVSYLI